MKQRYGVNALLRAYFISTLAILRKERKLWNCVNALLRAYFISTKKYEEVRHE